jgi:hypothetical protein
MRYLVGFVFFLFALGTLRVVGCGDESPCGSCDDGNDCTRDWCRTSYTDPTLPPPGSNCSGDPSTVSQCRSSSVADGTGCELDGLAGNCLEGECDVCVGCEPDGDDCTYGCNPDSRECEYIPVEDGAYCQGGNGACVSGTCCIESGEASGCNDENDCTIGCKTMTGVCKNVPLEDGTWASADCVCIATECSPPCEVPGVPDECPERDCLVGNCLPNPDLSATDGYCEYVPVENGEPCNESGMCIEGVCMQ